MTRLKTLLPCCFSLAGLLLSLSSYAGVYGCDFTATRSGTYTASWNTPQAIPDNTAVGLAYALNFGATGVRIQDIRVSLNISGGWNGDLYAYLSHGSSFAVLLNRVGASTCNPDGYSTPGLNILLTTGTASEDIHNVLAPSASSSGASYQADGRILYTDTARNNTLDVFNGQLATGSWTLFFADRAGGDVSTLNGWSLELTSSTPEPVNVALALFALLAAAWKSLLWYRSRHPAAKN